MIEQIKELIDDEIYNSKVELLDEVIESLYAEKRDTEGYIEQGRGILRAIEVIEYLKDGIN